MKIILTGGGTAGHVTPHINMLPELKKHFDKIEYIGSKTGIEKELIKNTGLPYHSITTCKFVRKKFWQNLSIPFRLAKGVKEAKAILKKAKPNAIFSKGGFVSVPVVIAASKLGIPIIAHESDKSPGLANRLCSKHCKVVFTSFKDTASHIKNGRYSGPPLATPPNISKQEAKEKLGISTNLPIMLITGGSLGAKALNTIVEQNLNELCKSFFIYHITGKGNSSKTSHPNYKQVEFTSAMPLLMRAADFAITRGGSNTIFELAQNHVPMLIVPLPKGNSRGDQEENAAYFESNGLSITLEQNAATSESLAESLKLLRTHATRMQAAQKEFSKTDAIKTIAKELVCQAKSSPLR